MKFDICLMNPPYGSTGGDSIHLKFVEKCLDIASMQVVVMPYTFITKVNHKPSERFKTLFDKHIISVQEENSNQFSQTSMPNVGIYLFKRDKQNNLITIKPLDREEYTVNSLKEISDFTSYEYNIIKFLENQGQQLIQWGGGHSHCTKQSLIKRGITDSKKIKEMINDDIIRNSQRLPKDKIYMIVNTANGGMNGTFISKNTGTIINNYSDLIKEFINRNQSTGYTLIIFNNTKEAHNCKIALQHPLLRFTCYRTQNDQNMAINRVYKYIPNIDWSDDRVKTDEGLLQVCGCPADKAKEYAEYCKKIIEEVNNK